MTGSEITSFHENFAAPAVIDEEKRMHRNTILAALAAGNVPGFQPDGVNVWPKTKDKACFNELMAEKLCELGWNTGSDAGLTKILGKPEEKELGNIRRLGDVDDLAQDQHSCPIQMGYAGESIRGKRSMLRFGEISTPAMSN